MTKNYLITRSVMFVMVIISALNIYSTKGGKNGFINEVKSVKTSPLVSRFIFKNTDETDGYSFANEALPINDAGIDRKMHHSLLKHNYRTVQSNILLKKADRLFPIIEPILRAYGIPDDFKYIPLVESGYGEGTSSKGAKGLWQFMPGTARSYGLKVGHGIDERKNVRKSTIAACRYLRGLYREFNNWTLTAAAYNNGSIKLARSIRRQNEDNYFRLHLNHETGVYVYNLIAMKAIVNEPKKYGYKHYHKNLDSDLSKTTELLALN